MRVHHPQAAPDGVGADHALELAEYALGRDALDRARVGRDRLARRGLDLEVDLDRDPDRAQAAQRVVREGPGGDHPHEPLLEVVAAVVRVEQLAAAERLGHRVDREVAQGEVGFDVVVAQGDEVDVPCVLGPDDTPRAERAAELERRPAGGLGQLAREALRVARDRQVDVVGVAAEQPVAHGAADQPGLLAGQRDSRARVSASLT